MHQSSLLFVAAAVSRISLILLLLLFVINKRVSIKSGFQGCFCFRVKCGLDGGYCSTLGSMRTRETRERYDEGSKGEEKWMNNDNL